MFRSLAALSLAEMDVRYYDLLAELAAAMAGPSPVVRAALRVYTALAAAVRVDSTILKEPRRTGFIVETVGADITAAGLSLKPEVVHRLYSSIGYPPATPPTSSHQHEKEEKVKVRRKVRQLVEPAPETTQPSSGHERPGEKAKLRRKVRQLPVNEPEMTASAALEEEFDEPTWDSIGEPQGDRQRQGL
jgi:hypothetical protein